jgi:hypothetical protein
VALFRRPQAVTEAATVPLAEAAALANQLELAQESLAGLEQLAREDVGWRRLGIEQENTFTRAGLVTIHGICLTAAIKSPLIKRGMGIRRNYVWGQGVEIAAKTTVDGDTTVNTVVQEFLDSPEYQRTLGSAQAREERENDLLIRGEFFIAAIDDGAGTVRPRLIPPAQVVDYITSPDDTGEVWFYKRTWTVNRVNLDTGAQERVESTEWHPTLDYQPGDRDRRPFIGGAPVRWDAPVQHCAVNSLTDACWGIPDIYPALDWARAYADFLTQWAILMRALSRYAWRTTAPGAKAAKVKSALGAAAGTDPVTGEPRVGGNALMSPDVTLEAIPKSGATIDADSGKPLAGMAAAALDVPLTMLLADPGSTGARAVAETLDRPLELTALARQAIWADWCRALLAHVLTVAAANRRLPGATVQQRGSRQLVTLADGQPPTVDVDFPPITDLTVSERLDAAVKADMLGTVPPLIVVRYALEALGVEDIDEVLDTLTDDNGEFLDPRVAAAAAAIAREQDGAPGSQAAEAYR